VTLKIPLRNLPAYISKTKASLEAYARRSDILDQTEELPGFVESTLKDNTSFNYRKLSGGLRGMEHEIDFLNVSKRDVRFMFRNLEDLGGHIPGQRLL